MRRKEKKTRVEIHDTPFRMSEVRASSDFVKYRLGISQCFLFRM
jgi:hypothetical protein